MSTTQITRRHFMKSATAATAMTGAYLGGSAPSFALPQASPRPINVQRQKKALVFIMLDGGNDSFNMLVPTTQNHFAQYQKTRSNLALTRQQLLPLPNFTDTQGRTFGVHHSMPEVQKLFAQNKLSFVANVAPMIEPVERDAFYSGRARLPLGLMSHSDQFKHWQTARPEARINRGWFGAFADALQPNRPAQQIPMNISLAGSNIMQNGVASTHYTITEQGSVGLVVNEDKTPLNQAILNSFEDLLSANYEGDPFKQTYLALTREAQAQHSLFRKATETVRVPTRFSNTPLSQQMRKVAQTIQASDALNLQQQTFFLRYIGWDHHDELLNTHAKMLRVLSRALNEFQAALDQMGLADRVVTFTGSDFGRTLTSNGNGTDHGWGGNIIVMGNPVQGGQVVGDYPSLSLGDHNALDVGDGVLIPTTPIDALYSELATWFGMAENDRTTLFPHLANFNSAQTKLDLLT